MRIQCGLIPRLQKNGDITNDQYIWLKNQDECDFGIPDQSKSYRKDTMGFGLYGSWFWTCPEADEDDASEEEPAIPS